MKIIVTNVCHLIKYVDKRNDFFLTVYLVYKHFSDISLFTIMNKLTVLDEHFLVWNRKTICILSC